MHAGNQLTGSLPASWGSDTFFSNLRGLYLGDNKLTGQVPLSWGAPAAFPVVRQTDLAANQLTGPLGGAWTHVLANSSMCAPLLPVLQLPAAVGLGPPLAVTSPGQQAASCAGPWGTAGSRGL